MTGDIHGDGAAPKMRHLRCVGGEVSDADTLIICGDVACLWSTRPEHLPAISAHDAGVVAGLMSLPWRVLFVDGNHDAHPTLQVIPRRRMYGGEVGVVVGESARHRGVYHLRRGEVYDIPDGEGSSVRVFAMGGANSVDRHLRTEGVDWWPSEVPSELQIMHGEGSLRAAGWEVDYVITHEASRAARRRAHRNGLLPTPPHEDRLMAWLDGVEERLSFRRWYMGHYHRDLDLDERHTILYHRLVRIGDPVAGDAGGVERTLR
ncbi:MAG: metallophosphatase [Coriobacteriales bacterium]|nr:metallophosphatase [Coriobacteriales bacterium]